MSNPDRPPIIMETAPKFIRQCKQCDAVMKEPLKVKDKIYMFCSATCKEIWDHEHAYRMKAKPEETDDDGDIN
jgi:endogenous inhibitor of DNA gyrase (YacG/DUF329 family)